VIFWAFASGNRVVEFFWPLNHFGGKLEKKFFGSRTAPITSHPENILFYFSTFPKVFWIKDLNLSYKVSNQLKTKQTSLKLILNSF